MTFSRTPGVKRLNFNHDYWKTHASLPKFQSHYKNIIKHKFLCDKLKITDHFEWMKISVLDEINQRKKASHIAHQSIFRRLSATLNGHLPLTIHHPLLFVQQTGLIPVTGLTMISFYFSLSVRLLFQIQPSTNADRTVSLTQTFITPLTLVTS